MSANHKYKDLLSRYPVGTVIELGRSAKLVRELYKCAIAIGKRMENIEEEIETKVMEEIKKLEAKGEDPSTVKGEIEIDFDDLPGIPMKLGWFVGNSDGPGEAAASLMNVIWLMIQSEMGLTSEEFGLLNLTIKEDTYLPVVTGYDQELF